MKKGPSVEGVTRETLLELYVDNPQASLESVARMLAVSSATVSRWLKHYGLPTKARTRPGRAKAGGNPQLEDAVWLKEQLDSGKMKKDIAAELGVNPAVVTYWAQKHGLANETKSAAMKEAHAKKYPDGRYGEKAGNWQGGRRVLKTGYVLVYAPDHPAAGSNGAVQEHRLVMEEHLGRYLEPNEVVHHKNGDKSDNRLENLELARKGQHTSNHFADGLEAQRLREENERLRKRIAELEEELGRHRGATKG